MVVREKNIVVMTKGCAGKAENLLMNTKSFL